MTEKEKKDYARMRIERDLKGSDNMKPYRKTKKASFLPPTPEEEERMKKLDMYGNPLPGYKWDGNEIVDQYPIRNIKVVYNKKNFKEKDGVFTYLIKNKLTIDQTKTKSNGTKRKRKRTSN